MHATLGELMLDLVQNAIEAKAHTVGVVMTTAGSRCSIHIRDDGCGMDEATLARALDPFFTNGEKHANRRFGLGLPFLKQQMETVGGTLEIRSEPGAGTTVDFAFDRTHLDAPPFPDIPGTVLTMMNFSGDYELLFKRQDGESAYEVSRNELLEALGGMNTTDELSLAKQYLRGLDEEFTTLS
ncbi:MAG: ATP-binding protein [Kiritimatiellae bacterium]|nr:ATP-binding protein [Kiritimatiellia bacterium]